MKYTRIEIRAFITLPFHGMGIQAGVSTPADKKKIISTDQKGALYELPFIFSAYPEKSLIPDTELESSYRRYVNQAL